MHTPAKRAPRRRSIALVTPLAAALVAAACNPSPAANATPRGASATASASASARPSAQNALEVRSPARVPLAVVPAGEPVPSFRAVTHDGRVVDVAPGPRPRPLVVYFYPRDETPGCTIQAQDFRDMGAQFTQAGADIVGVSTDDGDAHAAFATHHQLGYALVADPEGRLAAAFGVPTAGGFARRTTFVIDRAGRVHRAYENVVPRGHAAEVLEVVRALPAS